MHPNVHDQSQTAAFLWLRGHPQRFSSPIRWVCVCVYSLTRINHPTGFKKKQRNRHENSIFYSIAGEKRKWWWWHYCGGAHNALPPSSYIIATPLTLVCLDNNFHVWKIGGRTSPDRSFRFHYGGTREKKNQIKIKKRKRKQEEGLAGEMNTKTHHAWLFGRGKFSSTEAAAAAGEFLKTLV